MQAKTIVAGTANLCDFWGNALYHESMDDSRILVKLASKENSNATGKYLSPQDTYITCACGKLNDSKVAQKSVYAKMARGEMARYVASIDAQTPDQLKGSS